MLVLVVNSIEEELYVCCNWRKDPLPLTTVLWEIRKIYFLPKLITQQKSDPKNWKKNVIFDQRENSIRKNCQEKSASANIRSSENRARIKKSTLAYMLLLDPLNFYDHTCLLHLTTNAIILTTYTNRVNSILAHHFISIFNRGYWYVSSLVHTKWHHAYFLYLSYSRPPDYFISDFSHIVRFRSVLPLSFTNNPLDVFESLCLGFFQCSCALFNIHFLLFSTLFHLVSLLQIK